MCFNHIKAKPRGYRPDLPVKFPRSPDEFHSTDQLMTDAQNRTLHLRMKFTWSLNEHHLTVQIEKDNQNHMSHLWMKLPPP